MMGLASFLLASVVWGALPTQPLDPAHPGSNSYAYTLKQESFQLSGRKVDVFLPKELEGMNKKAPVLIFGHGQAIDYKGYELTFQHLARKGIAVIHPTFDSGFFDQEWRRMAQDFNDQAAIAIQKYSNFINPQQVIYSGHSKGAYVALMAAGAPGLKNSIGSVVLFAPAGFDEDYVRNINIDIPVTLVWSDADSIIKNGLISEIYAKLPSRNKQWISVKSYAELPADHFFLLNKKYFFGGQNGVSAYHYFSVWKWLVGAAWDLSSTQQLSNTYLYGDEAIRTGVQNLNHTVIRSW